MNDLLAPLVGVAKTGVIEQHPFAIFVLSKAATATIR
jgi:hypothetical protein